MGQNRIWIFQANQVVDAERARSIDESVRRFVRTWSSHGRPLSAKAAFVHRLFVLVEADESVNGVSGCAQDALVHFVRRLAESFGLDFFDRKLVALSLSNGIELVKLSELKTLKERGSITDDTVFYDTLISRSEDLEKNWLKALGDSWVKKWI